MSEAIKNYPNKCVIEVGNKTSSNNDLILIKFSYHAIPLIVFVAIPKLVFCWRFIQDYHEINMSLDLEHLFCLILDILLNQNDHDSRVQNCLFAD